MEEPQGHTTHTFNDASSGEPPAEGSAFNIGPTTTGEERAGPEFTNIYQTPPRKKQPSRLARYSGGSHRRSGGARRSSSSLTSRRRRSSTFNGVLNTVADENIPMTVQSNKARERAATAAAIDPGWSTLFVASPYAAPGSISRGSPLRCITPMNIEPPASPSVTGLKGRHRLQRDAAAAVLSAKDLRTGNWCDIERRHIAAYEYLCHVGEAKEWMEACIGSSLPEVGEFEESLRDGVALAKLAATFCPEVVGKIYEKEPPPKGNKRRLEFRHTDNINYFLAAIQIVGLPSLFHFELTDLYDRKNIPRVIHCIHALSHFLLRQGVAPAIKNLVGYLQFSEEQLKQTQKELDTVGTAVPVFTELETHIANQRVTGGKRPKVSNEFDDGWARLEGVERVRKYWEKEIEIVIQFQRLARRQLAVREVTEKRQARRYLEIVRNARIIQSLWRVALARIEFRRRLEENWERIEAARLEREAELERLRREEEEEEETFARQKLEQAELERRIREAEAERLYRQKQEEEEIFQQQQLQMDLEREGQKEAERIAQEQRAAAERQAAEMERLAREEAERQRQLELEHIAQVEREEEEARARTQAELEQQHRDLEEQKRELERRITVLQAIIRGNLARQLYNDMRLWMRAITKIQAHSRGILVRAEYHEKRVAWRRVESALERIQAHCRGALVRRRLSDRQKHFERNIDVIIKLQQAFRAKLAAKAYRTLTVEATLPTPKIIRTCAPLLDDTHQDIDEELELEQLRQKAVRQIRENQHTERTLNELDIKIALLVRNRISLEEVIKQSNRHFRFLDELRNPNRGSIASSAFRSSYSSMALAGVVPANSLYSLTNLDKDSRRRLECYQHLFYLMQTQPIYLARLLYLLNQGGSSNHTMSKSTMTINNQQGSSMSSDGGLARLDKVNVSRLMETIVLTLFGFAQNAREEYLLLKLFKAAIEVELESVQRIHEFLRGNPIFIKLAVHYNRGAKERKYLRDLLQPLVKKVLEDPDLDLESDPLVIYRGLIREEESRTGQRSRKPYDITREDALNDIDTRNTYIRHLRQLRLLADEFIVQILNSLDAMPYGIRYIARELRRSLTSKFPNEPEDTVMKVVGHLVYYRYINPAIVAPETFDVIETEIRPIQRKNLAEIAKMLNQVCMGRHFEDDNMFLQPLNNYVGYTSARFSEYSYAVTDVCDPETYFQIDEFTDLATLQQPRIWMSIGEIQTLHMAIEQNLNYVAPPIPLHLRQKFSSYDNVARNMEKRRTRDLSNEQEGQADRGFRKEDELLMDDEDEDDILNAIPEGTVLVERPDPSNPNNLILVLEDPLRVIMQDLGPAPRVRNDPYSHYELQLDLRDRFADEAITLMSGTASTNALSASASAILTDAATASQKNGLESKLSRHHTASAKEAVHAKAERAAQLHRLFLETKRKWIYILRVQSGTDLLDILAKPVEDSDEARWQQVLAEEETKLEALRQQKLAQWHAQVQVQQEEARMAVQTPASCGDGPGQLPPPAPPLPPQPGPLPGEKLFQELRTMTYRDFKRQVARAMRKLETERWVDRPRRSNIGTGANLVDVSADNRLSFGGTPSPVKQFRIRKADGYQGMLNAIARDVRTKARRRERRRNELRRIRQTLLNLSEKSAYLQSQREAYEQYLKSCTEQLAGKDNSKSVIARAAAASGSSSATKRYHTVLPFTRQYFHIRDLQRAGRVPQFGSYKYTAEQLYNKGVLVSVDGYPPRQLSRLTLVISSDEPGVFDIEVSLMGIKMPGGDCELRLEELLRKQYENVTVMTLFDGAVKVNVNLLIYLINKKFFS